MINLSIHHARIKIVSADISAVMQEISAQKIMMHDIVYENPLTVNLAVSQASVKEVKQICKARGDGIKILQNSTLLNRLKCYKKRWILFGGLVAIFVFTFWIPKHIFFYEVYGNSSVPEKKIVSLISSYGLNLGCETASVNSEWIKNRIMEEVPEIEWIGIRIRGCVAEVHIREKEIPQNQKPDFQISSIVAAQDGVIDSITVVKGVPLCKTGQAVQKGQVLISGYEDCGILLRGSNASGEIFACTNRNNLMYAPHPTFVRKVETERKYQYSLQVGKNIINFNNFSGISPASCVKIETKKYLTLPGGFTLPISFNIREVVCYDIISPDDYITDELWLYETIDRYVLQSMRAGEILHKSYSIQHLTNSTAVKGFYACREEIGSIRIEEILKRNGKND